MCFLAIGISSFEKVLFSSLAHFFIGSGYILTTARTLNKITFELPALTKSEAGMFIVVFVCSCRTGDRAHGLTW
jgi:hypothetical protein